MLGEISCAIEDTEEQIQQLFDEKEQFIQTHEGVLPKHVYLKQLNEIDTRIDELKSRLMALEREKYEIFEMERGR